MALFLKLSKSQTNTPTTLSHSGIPYHFGSVKTRTGEEVRYGGKDSMGVRYTEVFLPSLAIWGRRAQGREAKEDSSQPRSVASST